MIDEIGRLAERADLPDKPQEVSNFLFLRAMGHSRCDQAHRVGVSDRTLQLWEKKMERNLKPEMEVHLVRLCIEYQAEKRGEEGLPVKMMHQNQTR